MSYPKIALLYDNINQMNKNFKTKEKIIVGICRIIENGEECGDKVYSVGLCKRHYEFVEEIKKNNPWRNKMNGN